MGYATVTAGLCHEDLRKEEFRPGLQKLGAAPQGARAELLFDLVDGVADLFFHVGTGFEELQLLRIVFFPPQVAGSDADQADLLP